MTEKLKGIVRIAGADIKGEKQLFTSLQRIKGVGDMFANAICRVCNFDFSRQVGTLTDAEIDKIEKLIKDPLKFGIPVWMLNRRADPETGEDKYLSGPDLMFTLRQDIEGMKKIKCYKGVRHMYGLPVRGQRTKSSFRGGRTVGVVRKKVQPSKKKK